MFYTEQCKTVLYEQHSKSTMYHFIETTCPLTGLERIHSHWVERGDLYTFSLFKPILSVMYGGSALQLTS